MSGEQIQNVWLLAIMCVFMLAITWMVFRKK